MTGSHRSFVSYIDKSRDFYAAQGYPQPYRWAGNSDAPFSLLSRPLSECRVAVVTTSKSPDHDVLGPYAAPSSPPPAAMETEHLSWHKEATHTNDLGSFLPLVHLEQLAADGIIGSASPRFAGIPTTYSQRRTAAWADDVLQTLTEDDVDLAVLIPL
jgi:hypothetical protein